MVRLKRMYLYSSQSPSFSLNSTMVRLKLSDSGDLEDVSICRNSTMVRLKPAEFLIKHLTENGSQFHYGSIKTIYSPLKVSNGYMSQFHYGSIKTKICYGLYTVTNGLNSTMVRLKRC